MIVSRTDNTARVVSSLGGQTVKAVRLLVFDPFILLGSGPQDLFIAEEVYPHSARNIIELIRIHLSLVVTVHILILRFN